MLTWRTSLLVEQRREGPSESIAVGEVQARVD